MRSALELFQSSPAFTSKQYADLLNNPAFEPACAAALAVFLESLPRTVADPSKSWDCHLQHVGARSVLETLSQLHLKPEAGKPEPPAWRYPKTNPTPKGP